MRNNILSLKNIYNLLVMKDYPVEGGSVISGDRKKGMTLTKFWKENLLPQLTEGRYGTNIWKYTVPATDILRKSAIEAASC